MILPEDKLPFHVQELLKPQLDKQQSGWNANRAKCKFKALNSSIIFVHLFNLTTSFSKISLV